MESSQGWSSSRHSRVPSRFNVNQQESMWIRLSVLQWKLNNISLRVKRECGMVISLNTIKVLLGVSLTLNRIRSKILYLIANCVYERNIIHVKAQSGGDPNSCLMCLYWRMCEGSIICAKRKSEGVQCSPRVGPFYYFRLVKPDMGKMCVSNEHGPL